MTVEIRQVLVISGYILGAGFGGLYLVFQRQYNQRLKDNYPDLYKQQNKIGGAGWESVLAGWWIWSIWFRSTKIKLPQDELLLSPRKMARWTGFLSAMFLLMASQLSGHHWIV